MRRISQWKRKQEHTPQEASNLTKASHGVFRVCMMFGVLLGVIAGIGISYPYWNQYLKWGERPKEVASESLEQMTEDFREPSTADATRPNATEPILDGSSEEDVSQSSQTTSEESPVLLTEAYIDILAVGDNLFHRSLSVSGQQEDGTWDFSSIYAPVASMIHSADIAVINQETPMAGEAYGIQTYPRFNVPQQLAQTMVAVGFDVVTFATNHMLDMGNDGALQTISYWNQNYPQILTSGLYTSQEQRDRIPYYECKGQKIAFLNYTYGTNVGNVGNKEWLINYYNPQVVQEDIVRAKDICDFVIVCMHWGVEGQTTPNKSQYEMALVCAQAGADVVIGTHPHVVQPMTWITAPNGNQTLVYYSLGNFVSLQDSELKMLGGVARLRLRIDQEEEGMTSLTLDDYGMDFVLMHYNYNPDIPEFTNMKVYPWKNYTETLAKSHGLLDWGKKFSRKNLQAFIDSLGVISKP